MAELRRVEIIIKDKSQKQPAIVPNENPDADAKNDTDESVKAIIATSTLRKLGAEAREVAAYSFNRQFTLNDDYIGQRNMGIALSILSKSASLGQAALTGFMFGGPVGAVIGGAISVASTGVQIWENYDQQSIKLRQLDAQLSYSRVRAGYAIVAGSIGEDR
jgi:hypothetical protein